MTITTTPDQQRSRLKSAARIAAENGMRLTVKPDGTIVMEPVDIKALAKDMEITL